MNIWSQDLKVVYAQEPLPIEVVKSVFLAGPSPRDEGTQSWRPEALSILNKLGFDGHVFVPEPRDGRAYNDYTSQIEWETRALNQADIIIFWVPRDMKTLPALTTNIEWGLWADTGKCVLGTPTGAERVRYLQWMATKMKVPNYSTLEATLQEAVVKLDKGAFRKGGDAQVPLHIWSHPTFQEWLISQKKVGNHIESARVLWTFRVGQQLEKVFSWCLHVNVYIASEKRWKMNEYVLGRTDTVACVLYQGDQVVLVREFRSPVRNEAGFVYELPGGSSHNASEDQQSVIAHEVEEETGLKIDPKRFIKHETRQQMATFAAQVATLFSAELSPEELAKLKADVGNAHGVLEETERTYVEVWDLNDIKEKQLVDWVTLGMILSVV
jgi:8-oxo-dGTP pyrophosphatase MutT (NUDIX family)/nucleoside 2-deoxyribosyltransferase